MSAKLLKLKSDRVAAVLKAQECERAAKAGATPAINQEWDDALASVETLDAEIKAEQTAVDVEASAAAARAAKMAAINQRTGSRTQPRSASPVITSQRERAEADPNRGFRSHREFFNAVMLAGMGASVDDRLAPLKATAGSDEQGEYSNGFGGFLIPEGLSPNLLSVGNEADPTIGRTTQIPMATPTVKINARTDKNHTTSVTGGLRFYRRAETQEASASRMEMEQVVLHANPLTGVNFATEELLQDSPISVVAVIQAGFKEELGAQLLNEKLRGTGNGEMLGILNAGNQALISVAKETGQAAATIVFKNILNMRSRCWGYGQAIWLANHDTFPQLAQMGLAVGAGGVPVYIPSAVEDRPDMLLGRPIFYTEFAETVGTAGDLILSNWSQYLEGQLGGLESTESTHVRFLANERAFKINLRNDGRPWWKSALTPKKGANTLSPFVTLATRA